MIWDQPKFVFLTATKINFQFHFSNFWHCSVEPVSYIKVSLIDFFLVNYYLVLLYILYLWDSGGKSRQAVASSSFISK
jgi:hypothetical protein